MASNAGDSVLPAPAGVCPKPQQHPKCVSSSPAALRQSAATTSSDVRASNVDVESSIVLDTSVVSLVCCGFAPADAGSVLKACSAAHAGLSTCNWQTTVCAIHPSWTVASFTARGSGAVWPCCARQARSKAAQQAQCRCCTCQRIAGDHC